MLLSYLYLFTLPIAAAVIFILILGLVKTKPTKWNKSWEEEQDKIIPTTTKIMKARTPRDERRVQTALLPRALKRERAATIRVKMPVECRFHHTYALLAHFEAEDKAKEEEVKALVKLEEALKKTS